MAWMARYIEFEKWGYEIKGLYIFDQGKDRGTLLAGVKGGFCISSLSDIHAHMEEGSFYLATETNKNSLIEIPVKREIDKGTFLRIELEDWLKYCRKMKYVTYNVKYIDGIVKHSDALDEVSSIVEKISKGGNVDYLSSYGLEPHPVLVGVDIKRGLKESDFEFFDIALDG